MPIKTALAGVGRFQQEKVAAAAPVFQLPNLREVPAEQK
jgi:hypothetical protein